ncbi:19034_t:CDS:2 [Gigaspora margarita]|uniref:19034_t:CDS:1 n=1 Tax=Gigaspora margarita TaxID=4874 RepID=A0ABM8VZR8_GIGMA|nr:19034_t:CDS:2 [Gigaspora margarita]
MCAQRTTRRETLENLLTSLQNELNLNPSKPLFKLTYTSSNWPYDLTKSSNSNLKIAILDSSFNPPTKAHMNLLLQSVKNQSNTKFFDACLLLYAIKNADKTPSSSDVGPVDRLLMMESLASQICSINTKSESTFNSLQNIAIGVTTHPLFMDKAKAIHSYFNNNKLSSSYSFDPSVIDSSAVEPSVIEYSAVDSTVEINSSTVDSSIIESPIIDSSTITFNYSPQIYLYFILGFDTVVRLFNPQYYSNIYKELDSFFKFNNNIICANRDGYGGQEFEEKFFQSDIIKEIIEEMIKNILYDFCPELVAEFIIQERLYRNTR